MGQVLQFHTDPSAPCPHDREKAARMANLLFHLVFSAVCREARVGLYHEVGITEEEGRELDPEAVRILKQQVYSLGEWA